MEPKNEGLESVGRCCSFSMGPSQLSGVYLLFVHVCSTRFILFQFPLCHFEELGSPRQSVATDMRRIIICSGNSSLVGHSVSPVAERSCHRRTTGIL